MEQENDNCEKIISKASSIARIVVHYQQAYDILDEMVRFADTPTRALDSVYKLSRLISKTLRDITTDEDIKDQLLKDQVLPLLPLWAEDLEKALHSCFNGKDGSKWIREFASLSISPDRIVLELVRNGENK
ncbi:MAG: hypothetical protein AT710_08170 [Thermocladium sp. ECH_B]|jgi:hypothetical protein|nr:MAG: hypothetical protein AT710_08170 [Thermocladium sp. ECH_B]